MFTVNKENPWKKILGKAWHKSHNLSNHRPEKIPLNIIILTHVSLIESISTGVANMKLLYKVTYKNKEASFRHHLTVKPAKRTENCFA